MGQQMFYEDHLPAVFDLNDEPVTIVLDVEYSVWVDEIRARIGPPQIRQVAPTRRDCDFVPLADRRAHSAVRLNGQPPRTLADHMHKGQLRTMRSFFRSTSRIAKRQVEIDSGYNTAIS